MIGSAAIKQGRSANRKHAYFFFWPYELAALEHLEKSPKTNNGRNIVTTLVLSI